jgi:hypothetical protein
VSVTGVGSFTFAAASALLAQATDPAGPYRYTRPFMQPLPVWDHWPWLLLPLCIAVAVVYKSIKCRWMRQVPREATVLAVWILAGLSGAAAVLAIVVRLVERAQS